MRIALILFSATLVGGPAWAQVDFSGEWARDNHEDQPHRGPGAELGDYTGLPLNAAARRKAESWDASILSQPEQQTKPHPAQYSMRGPQPALRIEKVTDPVTGRLIAYTLQGYFGRADRVIWMDGRPHPSEFAEHTWGGFSTGEWEGQTLKVTTTHMKTSFINRNGAPTSYRGRMVEWFVRHGTMITHMSWVDDPIYFEEPMVRTNNFRMQLQQHTGPAIPFEAVDELADKPRGWVPSWPIGTEHHEFANRYGLPFEVTRGGRETLYPEYMQTIQRLMKSMPPKPAQNVEPVAERRRPT